MIDEIHIKLKAEFHLNYGTHGLDNKTHDLAKTVFGFMIKSVFSNYKEMVMLEPKYKHSSTDLFELTNKALDIIKNAGGTVITIITDSNRENINI